MKEGRARYEALGAAAWDAGEARLSACPFAGWRAEAWKNGLWKRRAEKSAEEKPDGK